METSEVRCGKIESVTPEVQTYWEQMAETLWGSYISRIERDAITTAAAAARKRFGSAGTAIDVGCDGGRWSRLLADDGWSLVCTDVKPDKVELCQSRIPAAKCLVTTADMRHIPAASESAQLLLCIEVPEVILSDWFLPEVQRVLQPGGYLAATICNRRSLRGVFGHLRARLLGRFDYYVFHYPHYRVVLAQHGFELIQETGFCWFFFNRFSNSRLVPVFAAMERLFGLNACPSISPWIAFVAAKRLV